MIIKTPCKKVCHNCETEIPPGSGYYNSPEGALCCPCADIVESINQMKSKFDTPELKKKFEEFIKSDIRLTAFLDNYFLKKIQ